MAHLPERLNRNLFPEPEKAPKPAKTVKKAAKRHATVMKEQKRTAARAAKSRSEAKFIGGRAKRQQLMRRNLDLMPQDMNLAPRNNPGKSARKAQFHRRQAALQESRGRDLERKSVRTGAALNKSITALGARKRLKAQKIATHLKKQKRK